MVTVKLNIPEKKGKTGEYNKDNLDRIADIHDTYTSYRGKVMRGHAEKAGYTEKGVLGGIAVMETGAGKNTRRGFMYNFDDSPEMADYKATAHKSGEFIANAHEAKKHVQNLSSDIAVPRGVAKYTMPSYDKAEKEQRNARLKENTNIAAAMHVMQDKVKSRKVRSLPDLVQAWRGPREAGYIPSVLSAAKQLKYEE